VDEFLGENKGLIVAEIELKNENDEFEKPDWIVAIHPFKDWTQ